MSDLTLIIGNKNYSSWSLRPWIFMKTAGIEFIEKRVALDTNQTRTKLEPYFSNHKVPVLLDKNLAVWDSLAILEYIAEKYPTCHGWPADPHARAVARSVSAEMHSSFFELREGLPINCRKKFTNFSPSSGALKDIERIKAIWRYCKERFSQNGPWLFDTFCIADAMFAPVVFRFDTYCVSLSGFEKKYTQSMLSLPHMIEWKEAGKQEKEILEFAEVKQ
ncbi:MAG: glutathione S-transferase family protein [Desulfobacterales bacterium]|nr:glutathione S-transferase family protein [Desulfobacterales bacterium]